VAWPVMLSWSKSGARVGAADRHHQDAAGGLGVVKPLAKLRSGPPHQCWRARRNPGTSVLRFLAFSHPLLLAQDRANEQKIAKTYLTAFFSAGT
jgi:hypothetical protein